MWEMLGTVLVVEADPLLRVLLEDVFSASGANVLSAATCNEALAALGDDAVCVDAAILDISNKIDGIFAVADLMHARGTPFIFTIPLLSHAIPPVHQLRPAVAKPYGLGELFNELTRARACSLKQSGIDT